MADERFRVFVLVLIVFLGIVSLVLLYSWPVRETKVEIGQWRFANDGETADVYVPTPCPHGGGLGCERGIAPWLLDRSGREKQSKDVQWVRLGTWWHPARTDLENGVVVVFDGFSVEMKGTPGGGQNLGTLKKP